MTLRCLPTDVKWFYIAILDADNVLTRVRTMFLFSVKTKLARGMEDGHNENKIVISITVGLDDDPHVQQTDREDGTDFVT